MKISVIVPVYNVEKYLNKCVLSIINQTYKNLEIILVNDGSTDSSSRICEDLKSLDSRIEVIHKMNGGLSSARNAGLNVITGDYIGFIDSDDWIEPDYFELLVSGVIDFEADISVVQFVKVRDFSRIEFISTTHQSWVLLNREQAMESLFDSNYIGYSAVNKIYRAQLFDNIRFPEGKLMEDKATTYKLIHRTKRLVVNYSKKYHYYLRVNSIIRSEFNRKKFDSFEIHDDIVSFIDLNYPNLSNLIRARYAYTAVRMLLVMTSTNYNQSDDIERCVNVIKTNIRYLLNEKGIRISVKFLAIIVSRLPFFAHIITNSKIASSIIRKVSIS